jgi:hypothetical protein
LLGKSRLASQAGENPNLLRYFVYLRIGSKEKYPSLSPTFSSQELAFFNFKLFENIGKQVGANGFGWMNRDRSPATIFMMKYSVTTLLANPFKPQRLKPLNHLPGFKGR